MDNEALKNEFLVESFENLSSITEDLTTIEKNPNDSDLLNKIYRTVHTMKGSASFLGYKKLQELTHSSENLLDVIREGKIKITPSIVDTLFKSFDICSNILKAIEDHNNEGDFEINDIKERLENHLNGKDEAESEESSEASSSEDVQEDIDDAFDDMKDMIASHREESEAINNTEEPIEEVQETKIAQVDESGISSAALESMKELISEGKMSQDSLDNITNESKPAQETVSEPTPSAENETINQAALDSLKELAGDGSIDPEIIKDLESQEAKPTETNTKSEVIETKEETIAQAPVVEAKKEEKPAPKQMKKDTAPAPGEDIAKKSIADSVVRVNVNVLDKIMNTVGELVLNRNQILQFSNNNSNTELSRLALQLNTITSELQSDVMSTRMQPIGSVLTKFERLVRDFARNSDKKIQLQLSGQDTELDKTLIEAIKDPLVHIIRNSCDHGIESSEDRIANGKNEVGVLSIKAYNESGQVTIEISDDGKGLSRSKILDKALEKGIVRPEDANLLSDQQVFSMIFAPGFSTAEKVTNISGRGVGMDVVKTNIEKIGGSVILNSKEGEGTVFKLRIPLTLAIVPALIVKSHDESFAIPQLNLVELVRLETEEDKKLIEKVQGSEFLKLRGSLTPVFRLNNVLNLIEVNKRTNKLLSSLDTSLSQSTHETKEEITKSHLEYLESENIVILSAEGHDFGIIVDEILDTEEIVVKPLNNAFKNLSTFGGATIMGDGKIALILDALGFLNQFSSDREKKTEDVKAIQAQTNLEDVGEEQENILFRLNDDRIYAVPLSLVTRLEEFSKSKVELTGKQPIVRYLDAPMPLINVENTLKLGVDSLINDKEQTQLPCIVTTIRNKNYGIIVKEIMDISIDNVTIDATAVDREGILGTVFINDKTVSLLDLYKIIDVQKIGIKPQSVEMKEKSLNSQKKILLVDDSAMYRKMESDALLELGYQVTLAKHGEDGFQTLEKDEFDLIVTDIEMPILNGYEFAQKVRSSSTNQSDITIVALSTRASKEDKEKGLKAGFNYHLEKFRRDEVIDLIKNIFNGDK